MRSAATAASLGLTISLSAASRTARATVRAEPDPEADVTTLNALLAAEYDAIATYTEGDESQHFIVLAALVLGLAAPGPNLSAERAGDVVPEAFVASIGDRRGLHRAPPDYFR